MMNIDKFGHHIHKRLRFAENLIICRESLSKSENGDFDLQSVRLKGVKFPVSDDDAVNKKYVDEIDKISQTRIANIAQRLARVESQLFDFEQKFCKKEDVYKIIKGNIK